MQRLRGAVVGAMGRMVWPTLSTARSVVRIQITTPCRVSVISDTLATTYGRDMPSPTNPVELKVPAGVKRHGGLPRLGPSLPDDLVYKEKVERLMAERKKKEAA